MIGETVSHYRITRQLGAGGMGVVYEAEDLKLKRTVALKFLPAESTVDPHAKERFVQEAQAASALDHPNICNIHEIDETPDGRLFIVMACYHGETLAERIARGPLDFADALDIASQMAAGLAKAHAQGIVHRDTKPGNVFITADGQVKILDFGIAKLAGQASLTRTDAIVGTVQYMAPEQARNEEVDGRADIWALGAVLYQMVTGCLPFGGESAGAVIFSIVGEEPPPPSSLDPELPRALDGVLARCLAKSPEARYQTMEQLGRDLEGLAGGAQQEDLLTVPLAAPARPRTMNRRRAVVLGAALVLVVAVFAVFSIVQRSGQSPESGLIRIAVLPFENLGPDSDMNFCEGVTDVVTARLVGIAGLGVASRQSARGYRGSHKNARAIGRELAVDYLLEGTVQRENPADSSSRLRITPQLIRVDDDTHAWAKTYDLVTDSAFQVQSAIAERVAFELGITLLVPSSGGPDDRVWSREMYLEQARQSLETALGLRYREPMNTTLIRSHFEMAIRSLIAVGQLNPDHGDGDDLARAFTTIRPELDTALTGPEIYRAYLDIGLATGTAHPTSRDFDLENELALVLAEFGVAAGDETLPPQLIARVEDFITSYTGEWRRYTESAMARSVEQLPLIRRELRRRNLPDVLSAIPFVESGYKTNVRSKVGAVGMWQIMPRMAKDYGLKVEADDIDQRLDPVLSTVAAVEYLDYLLGVFGANQFMCAVAAYNSGAGKMRRCVEAEGDWRSPLRFWDLVESDATCLDQETKGYVPRFLAAAVILRRPEAFGLGGE